MTDIKTLGAVADLIKAHGGEDFCRGFMNAARGGLYDKPNLIDYPEYLRGFVSVAGRKQLENIAGVALPHVDFTGCPDEIIKARLIGLVE